MNLKIKKGLADLLLSSYILAIGISGKEFGLKQAYSAENYNLNQKQEIPRDHGFSSEGLVYTGIIILGSYYFLKRRDKR